MKDLRVKKPLPLTELHQFDCLDKVIIESVEQTLYRLLVEAEGICYYVIESPGKSLTRRSILEIQELLSPYIIKGLFLSHSSPYDEMIGMDVNHDSNELLVPIGNYYNSLPEGTLH